jgi:hypothetical protein
MSEPMLPPAMVKPARTAPMTTINPTKTIICDSALTVTVSADTFPVLSTPGALSCL